MKVTTTTTPEGHTVETTTVEPGKYLVLVTLADGRQRSFVAKKTREGNPSARGGAYKTVYQISIRTSNGYARPSSDTLGGVAPLAVGATLRFFHLA